MWWLDAHHVIHTDRVLRFYTKRSGKWHEIFAGFEIALPPRQDHHRGSMIPRALYFHLDKEGLTWCRNSPEARNALLAVAALT